MHSLTSCLGRVTGRLSYHAKVSLGEKSWLKSGFIEQTFCPLISLFLGAYFPLLFENLHGIRDL